ncbi:FAD-dependent oxidoreductase, partial [Myxococcus vastator]|uniref:FAD-dependent oxidoreductase n=1 Tax=Myxococcus vastator TaxID=2709664 RepID=UPI0013D5BDEF
LLHDSAVLGVIGGGVAGLTAAAAAARLGCKVYLLEKHSDVLALQGQNRTRWLHPHLYDWPEEGADRLWADLPVLNWKAAPAEDVIKQLRKEWEWHVTQYKGSLSVHCAVKSRIVDHKGSLPVLEWQPGYAPVACDAIILALGFGLEDNVPGVPFVSYWQNDDLDQTYPFDGRHPKRFLVSGLGDGGLIEFIRLRLNRFNHWETFAEFLKIASTTSLKGKLLEIETIASNDSKMLTNAYSTLAEATLDKIDSWLAQRLRKDTDVTLLGSQYPAASNARILTRFLATRILKVDGASGGSSSNYISGRLDKAELAGDTYAAHILQPNGQNLLLNFDRIIVRHGQRKPAPLDEFDKSIAQKCIHLMEAPEPPSLRKPLWAHAEPGFFSGVKRVVSKKVSVEAFVGSRTESGLQVGSEAISVAACVVLTEKGVRQLQQAFLEFKNDALADPYVDDTLKKMLRRPAVEIDSLLNQIEASPSLWQKLIQRSVGISFEAYLSYARSSSMDLQSDNVQHKLLRRIIKERLQDKKLRLHQIRTEGTLTRAVKGAVAECLEEYERYHGKKQESPCVTVDGSFLTYLHHVLCRLGIQRLRDENPAPTDFNRFWGKIRAASNVITGQRFHQHNHIQFHAIRHTNDLALHLRCRAEAIETALQNIPASYEQIAIPKRGKSRRGEHRIVYNVVDEQLKQWQKILQESIVNQMPQHQHIQGFLPKRSIISNARQHLAKRLVLHADIESFFDTIRYEQVLRAFED